MSTALLTLIGYLNTGADPNFITRDSGPPARKQSAKLIHLRQLRTANRDVVNIEGIMLLFIRIDYLHGASCLRTIQNLAVDAYCSELWSSTDACAVYSPLKENSSFLDPR